MVARYASSQLIQTIERGGKAIAVEFVDRASHWIRPSNFPIVSVRNDFVEAVSQNVDILQQGTAIVAIK